MNNCYKDSSNRILKSRHKIAGDSSLTIEKCQEFCFEKNYLYAGVQYANECFCGNAINPKILGPKTDCNYACSGDSSQICGGFWRMNIYKNPGTD